MVRDARQDTIFTWAKKTFGTEWAVDVSRHGLQLLKQAAKIFRKCKGTSELAHLVIDYVFSDCALYENKSNLEVGRAGVYLLLLASAAGVSADVEEQREFQWILSGPADDFVRGYEIEWNVLNQENSNLRKRLKQVCMIARALNARFEQVWQAAVTDDTELTKLTGGMKVSYVIDLLENNV